MLSSLHSHFLNIKFTCFERFLKKKKLFQNSVHARESFNKTFSLLPMCRINVPMLTLLLKANCMCCSSSACIYESLKALCSFMVLVQNVYALFSSLLPSWDNKTLGKQLNYPIRHIVLPITLSETDSFSRKSFMSKKMFTFLFKYSQFATLSSTFIFPIQEC